MRKKAVLYIVRLIIQRCLGLLCFLLGSWWLMTDRAWIYFGSYFAVALLSAALLYRINPETLARRGDLVTDSPLWDKILLSLLWILSFFVIYGLAGLEAAKQPAIGPLFWLGLALSLLSSAISLAALLVNPFLESTARIQTDRDQKVIATGIYKVVRHPTYAAVLLWCLAIVLIFPSLLPLLTACLVALVTLIRTWLEDRMLMEKLEGYSDYSRKTKYRLIPYIW